MTTRPAVYQFGPFEFDLSQFELRNGDQLSTLPVAMNKLLLLFVREPGKLITRDQIADELWEEQGTVDTTAGVYTAIKRLRDQLGGDAGPDSFIQTVVGAGYRLIAPVTVVVEPVKSANEQFQDLTTPPPPPLPEASPITIRRLPLLLSGFALLAVVLVAGAWRWFTLINGERHRSETGTASTALLEHIYPVSFNEGTDAVLAQSISPDGKSVAWSDQKGITLTTLDGGSARVLLTPPALRVSKIAWFPDNEALLVSGTSSQTEAGHSTEGNSDGQIWRVALNGEPARLLVADGTYGSVSPKGDTVSFLRSGLTEIWLAAADGTAPHKLVGTTDGSVFTATLWSPLGKWLITSRSQSKIATLSGAQVKSVPDSETSNSPGFISGYEIYSAITGKRIAHQNGDTFSTAVVIDGKSLLCLVGQLPNRLRWAILKLDLEKGTFLSQAEEWQGQDNTDVLLVPEGQLSVSDDSHKLSFLAKRVGIDVTTADLSWSAKGHTPSLKNITRPVLHTLINYPTAWSPDGKMIAFDQGFHGANAVMGQRLDGSGVVTYAGANGSKDVYAQGHFSPEGRWLLYLHLPPGGKRIETIERVPAAGGDAHVVPVSGQIESFTCSASKRGRCVLREVDDQKSIIYYELDPLRGKGSELVRVPWQPVVLGDWSVSPDGTTVAMANHAPEHPVVQLVSLKTNGSTKLATQPKEEILLRGFGTILEPTWTADGRGLFVETALDSTYQILFTDASGHDVILLRQSPDLIWVVPSPEGQHIAFPENTNANSNAWFGSLSRTLVH